MSEAHKPGKQVTVSGAHARDVSAAREGEVVAREYRGRKFVCPETGRDLTLVDIVKHVQTLWPVISERRGQDEGAKQRRAQLLELAVLQAADWAKYGVPGQKREEEV